MAVASSRVTSMAINQPVSNEDLGGWRMHTRVSGLVDMAVDTDREALDVVKRFLSYLPSHHMEAPPVAEVPAGSDRAIERILDIDEGFGTFDYILCHGVYSWVPAPVREKILEILDRNLSPDGIGYISYNTYPGWHTRGMIRAMLAYHVRRFEQPRVLAQPVCARALVRRMGRELRHVRDLFVDPLSSER